MGWSIVIRVVFYVGLISYLILTVLAEVTNLKHGRIEVSYAAGGTNPFLSQNHAIALASAQRIATGSHSLQALLL